ncbi:NADH-quinone oxidoreductase subunit C [Methanoregula sp.]|uniref:hydrogenase large subunit n=1 Tax=Methanoregula sp. TaxID=2052170 RepID=UPI00260E80A0|nr:NADH-quinone oxidoreductase subunit C [Methanoregula sp.]MDD5142121.1 NADH-quinone oxidoreductase subunit C [Methanoregula sp.]
MNADESTGKHLVHELLGPGPLAEQVTEGCNGEWYVRVSGTEFLPLVTAFASRECALIGLFCTERFSPGAPFSLLYVFEKKGVLLVIVLDTAQSAPSIARLLPSACWPERECRDGFGIAFEGLFDERRLLLHETYPDDYYSLKKSVANVPPLMKPSVDPSEEYPFRSVQGDGVYQIPVGPVHAGIIEPGHFRFSVIGEKIFNLEVRMFYKHRGIEKLAERRLPEDVVRIAESVSGDESVVNTVAFCIAAEKIAGTHVPERAWALRTIFMELERIGSHLGDQAGMLVDVAFPLGASQFAVIREEVFRINALLTGSRFLRGMVVPGGISRDIRTEDLEALAQFVRQVRKRYRTGLKIVLSTASVIDRFSPTGVVRRSILRPLNITGPTSRASGGNGDVRVDHPYGIYSRHPPSVRTLHDGDVLSRFTVRASEILDSLDLIERLLTTLPEGTVKEAYDAKDGYTLSLVESARGQNLCWVWIRDGVVERYKVRTASYCNWLAIEHAVQGEIVPDFPLINKSLNLSYAGTDL